MSMIFNLFVSYSQVAVFVSNLNQPFNDWTDEHVAQGFSWREGSVSFRVPQGEDCVIEVLTGLEETGLIGSPSREIRVPFTSPGGEVSVASITAERKIQLPEGRYQLTFELIPITMHNQQQYDCGIRFRFVSSDEPEFLVVTGDEEMNPGDPLLKTAVPAS